MGSIQPNQFRIDWLGIGWLVKDWPRLNYRACPSGRWLGYQSVESIEMDQ